MGKKQTIFKRIISAVLVLVLTVGMAEVFVKNGTEVDAATNIDLIRANMLELKLQDDSNTVSEGTSKFSVRFIASVDSLDYSEAGFVFSLSNSAPTIGTDKCVQKSTTKVYRSLNIGEQTISVDGVYPNSESEYLYAFAINNTPANQVIYARAYVKCTDGTVVYGTTRVVTAPEVVTRYQLADNGKSDYSILIPAEATENELFAANELQYFFEEATGVQLPIQKEGTSDTPEECLSVGDTLLSRDTGIIPTYEEVKISGFVLKTVGNDCYIKGANDIGTRNGVYEFLSRCVGYECYAEDVINIDEKLELRLPRLEDVVVPSFDFRSAVGKTQWNDTLAYRMQYNTTSEFFVTDRLCHNSYSVINPYTYDYTSEQYKSWYSETMFQNQQLGALLPAQLCYSNEEMRKEYVKNLKLILEKTEDPIMLMGQEDGPDWCTCTECAASKATYGTNSAVLIQFANAVQKEISEWYETEHPNKEPIRLMIFAYDPTMVPPVRYDEATQRYQPIDESVKLDERLGIFFSIGGYVYASLASETDEERIARRTMMEGWNALTEHMFVWSHSFYAKQTFVMCDIFEVLKENYQVMLQNGVCGITEQTSSEPENAVAWESAKCYVLSKLQWNANLDIERLLDDFFSQYFGVAGDVMHQLFDFQREHYKTLFSTGKMTEHNVSVEPLTKQFWSKGWITDAMEYIDAAYDVIAGYQERDPSHYQMLYDKITLEALQYRFMFLALYGSESYSEFELMIAKCAFRKDAVRLEIKRYKENKSIDLLWDYWNCTEDDEVAWLINQIDNIKVTQSSQQSELELLRTAYEGLSEKGKYDVTSVRYEKLKEAIALAKQLAEDGKKYNSFKDTYDGIELTPQAIRVDSEKLQLQEGDSRSIIAMVVPYYATGSLNYSVADVEVAEVDDNGLLIAKKAGTTTLTVGIQNTDISKTISVYVYEEWNELSLSYVQTLDGALYLLGDNVLSGPDVDSNIQTVYGNGTTMLQGEITYTVDDVEKTEMCLWSPLEPTMDLYRANMKVCSFQDGEGFTTALQSHTVSNITIKAGTILTYHSSEDNSYGTAPIYITNDITLDMGTDGNWELEYNEIQLTYTSTGDKGFYFDVEIVAGPNKGGNLSNIYGNWASPSPIGEMSMVRNGKTENMRVMWCVYRDTLKFPYVYLSGNFQNYIDQLTEVILTKGTVVIPTSAAGSRVPMRLANDVHLVRNEDGILVNKSEVFSRYVTIDGDFQIENPVNQDAW